MYYAVIHLQWCDVSCWYALTHLPTSPATLGETAACTGVVFGVILHVFCACGMWYIPLYTLCVLLSYVCIAWLCCTTHCGWCYPTSAEAVKGGLDLGVGYVCCSAGVHMV